MSHQNLSELAIIEAIRMGSEKILFSLYEEYRNEFVGWAITNNQLEADQAKDIFQNTIIAFHQNVKEGKFDGSNSTLKTYLFSIGKNYLRLHYRAKTKTSLHDDINEHVFVTPEENTNELHGIVKAAMNSLGNRCKMVLLLFYERGFDMDSIARELGLKNRNVAKKTKYECLKKLENDVKERLKSA